MKTLSILCLVALLGLLAVGPATAADSDGGLELFAPTLTATERLELWQDNLQSFAEDHPLLTEEQMATLDFLGQFDDPSLFSEDMSREVRLAFATAIRAIGRTLSAEEADRFSDGIPSLELWLQDNGLLSEHTASFLFRPKCSCSSFTCLSGYACVASNCRRPEGTAHTGVCAQLAPEFEPEL